MPEESKEESEEVYTEEGREHLVEDDEIDPAEEAFMEGYDNESHATCAVCNKPFVNEPVLEREIEGKMVWFCSESCLDKYKPAE